MLSEKDTKIAIDLFRSIGQTNQVLPVTSLFSDGTKGHGYIIIVNPTEKRTCDMVLINIAHATQDQLNQFEDHKHRVNSKSLKGVLDDQITIVFAFYNDN